MIEGNIIYRTKAPVDDNRGMILAVVLPLGIMVPVLVIVFAVLWFKRCKTPKDESRSRYLGGKNLRYCIDWK
jgi:hypothetical protein